MIKKLKDYTFSTDHSLQERRFILAGLIAQAAILAVLLSVVTSKQGLAFTILLIICFAVLLLVIIFTMRTKHFLFGECVIILMSNLLILPIGYHLGGGLLSGAPAWLVIGMVFVFVLSRGALFWVYLLLTAGSFALTTYMSTIHPEWVRPLKDGYSPNWDSYIAVVMVALLIGLLFRFQSSVLERELDRAEDQKEEIERLSDMQSSFFSSMSHEIRTPISTIIGLNEMTMREENLSEEVLENTENIQNASKMLLSLINDLLDVSKIQSGKMEIIPSQYETARMLSEITNLHWSRATEKGLHFDVQVSADLPPLLFGDETRVKQIVINLVANAIKYTEEGFVTLRFGGERVNEDTFLLRVDVEDTGIGIRKENIPFLFDTFRRIEGEETKNIEGTGLGLSISKQLVDMMNGTITVNSIYTKGSTFRVEIPQGIVATDTSGFQSPELISKKHAEYQQSFEAPRAHVLIVDDNEMNRVVCRKLLRSTRVQVDLAESGKKCLELARDQHYDAIFMDHEMPQMDGIETLRRLRAQRDGLNRSTPVIALTANAGSDKNAFYTEQGFSAYLAKPIKSARLESLLLACLPPDLIERSYMKTEEDVLQIHDTVHKRPFLITTDSICDLPDELLKDNDIQVMPYYIETEKGRFRDLQEIDADNLQHFLEAAEHTVQSVPAPVEDYEIFFGSALTEARFVLHLSSCKAVSTAYNNATLAARSFGNVHVMDTGEISTGLGMMVLRAAHLFRNGLRLEEVLQDLEAYRQRIRLYYLVPSLGRVNSKHRTAIIPRLLMNVFNMEPVFTTRRGRLVIRRFLMGYIRSTADQFIRFCLMNRNNISTKRLYVTFTGCPPELKEHVIKEIERYAHFDRVIVTNASAATFSNCGPGSFGLIYELEKK